MNTHQLDQILRESLDDLYLSRKEKRAIKSRIGELDLSASARSELRHQAFVKAREYTDEHGAELVLDWLDDITRVLLPAEGPSVDARAFFSPSEGPKNTIIGLLRAARKQVDICVFTITDNSISEAITGAHERGVEVRVITDNHKAEDRGSDIDRLIEAGVWVVEDQTDSHMHHKFAIFDHATLLTGSYNWTRSAADRNQENIIVTDEPRLVRPFIEEFTRLVREFEY